jgi:hypothetical protein
VGILEDDLHFTANCAQLAVIELTDILALKTDIACVWTFKQEDAESDCRFPRTALPN